MGYRRGAPLAWRFRTEDQREIRFVSATAHEISDGDAKLQACLAGAGIAQFPEAMVIRYLEQSLLVPLLAEYTPEPVELNIVWPRTKHLFPKIRLIVDELLKKAEDGHFGPLR